MAGRLLILAAFALSLLLTGCPPPSPPAPSPPPAAAPPPPPPAGEASAPPVEAAEVAPPAPDGEEVRRGQNACPVCQASPRFPAACVLCNATGLVRAEHGPEALDEFLATLAPWGRRADYEALSAQTEAQASWDRGDLAALSAWAHGRAAPPAPVADTPAGPDEHTFSGQLLAGVREGVWRRPEGSFGPAVESTYRAGMLHGVHFKGGPEVLAAGTAGYWEYVLGTELRMFHPNREKVVVPVEELVCGIPLPRKGGRPTREQLLRWLPWEWLSFPLGDLEERVKQVSTHGLRKNGCLFVWGGNRHAASGQFTAGLRTGPWTFAYTNGKPMAEGTYDSGRVIGEWTWFRSDGQVRFKARFSDRGALKEILAGE